MAFYLQRTETVQEGLSRIVEEQIRSAINLLSHADDPHDAIHEARKAMKKNRALLRLVRVPLGKAYAQHNEAFRDIARQLSPLRDATAVLESLDKLEAADFLAPIVPQLQQLQQHFRDEREQLAQHAPSFNVPLKQSIRALKQSRHLIKRWPSLPNRYRTLAPGLTAGYQQAQQQLQQAIAQPRTETLHQWRKRVKYHGYQMRLLEQTWPQGLACHLANLKTLAEFLGDDHDLSVLQQLLQQRSDLLGSVQEQAAIMALLQQHRQQLQTEAFQLGRRLFIEPADAFRYRMRGYWRCWKNP